jgi:hypothetical protein
MALKVTVGQLKRIIKEAVEEGKAKAGLQAAIDSLCKEYNLEVQQDGDKVTLSPKGGETQPTGKPTGRQPSKEEVVDAWTGSDKPRWDR